MRIIADDFREYASCTTRILAKETGRPEHEIPWGALKIQVKSTDFRERLSSDRHPTETLVKLTLPKTSVQKDGSIRTKGDEYPYKGGWL